MEIDSNKSLKSLLHEIIYEADTSEGKLFDVVLLILILLSVFVVMLDSISIFHENYRYLFDVIEWIITVLFSIEYALRIVVVKKPLKYITSFYGIIDLLSILPQYLSFFFVSSGSLAALRALRLLRVFRILKLTRFIGESNFLVRSLKASRAKIAVFLFAVFILSIIFGTIMYLIEGEENGFTSIPESIYWTIVTLTTVGYGDIVPGTSIGRLIAAIIMIMGYGIIAVPTGIVSAEMAQKRRRPDTNTQSCLNCAESSHKDNAQFCHSCGNRLHEQE
jgi:voltage-gated potassium channel